MPGPFKALRGTYFYADYCRADVWATGAPIEPQLLFSNTRLITSFGEDEAGNLYLSEDATNARIMLISDGVLFKNGFEQSAAVQDNGS